LTLLGLAAAAPESHSRSLNVSGSWQPLVNYPSPPLTSSFLTDRSRPIAFADARQGKDKNAERRIKVMYKGDTRRFSLTASNFTYSALLQTLRLTYQISPSTMLAIKYYDEEHDLINITTTTELREAYRLLCVSSSPSSPSLHPSSRCILELVIDNMPSSTSPSSTSPSSTSTHQTKYTPENKKQKKNTKNGNFKRKKDLSLLPSSSLLSGKKQRIDSKDSPVSSKNNDLTAPFPITLKGNIPSIDLDPSSSLSFMIDSSMSIAQVKNLLQFQPLSLDQPLPNYRLTFQGEILDSNKTIKDYGITKNSIIEISLENDNNPLVHHTLSSTNRDSSSDTKHVSLDSKEGKTMIKKIRKQCNPISTSSLRGVKMSRMKSQRKCSNSMSSFNHGKCSLLTSTAPPVLLNA